MKSRAINVNPQTTPTLSLKIHCPVFNHIKNTIVCSLCCVVRDKCRDFQQFYQQNQEAQDKAVDDYVQSHRRLPPGSLLTIQYILEVMKDKMSDTYVWIDQDDRADVMTMEQVIQAAESGRKPKHIFLTKQELMLRYQLVPRTRQEGKDTAKETVKELAKEAAKPGPKAIEAPLEVEEEVSEEKGKKRQGKAVA